MIWVSYGAPAESRSNGAINEGEITWSPERVSNALGEDDLYVGMSPGRDSYTAVSVRRQGKTAPLLPRRHDGGIVRGRQSFAWSASPPPS
jgi:hypothetical protein